MSFASAMAARVRTLAFDLPQNPVSFEILAAGETKESSSKIQLEARRNQFGKPVDLAPGRYIVSSPAFPSVTGFTLADTKDGRFLLIVLPAADRTCFLFVVPDDAAAIGPGDRFVINTTGKQIGIRFGTGSHLVKPGHSLLLHPPAPAAEDGRVAVEMSRELNGKRVIFNSTYWPLDPRARSFVIIYQDRPTGNPRVRNLSEVP